MIHEAPARLSQLSLILDKHGDPKVMGPADAIKIDPETGKTRVDLKGSQFLPRDGMDDAAWEYLTWDAKLESAYGHLDKTIDLVCIQMEMSPALIGLTQGAGVEATDTLRLRAFNTLDAVASKRVFMKDGLSTIGRLVLKLSGVKEPETVQADFGDPLPLTRKEAAEAIREERDAGIMSLDRAVKTQNPEWTDEEVQAEIDLIRAEETAIFNPGQE